MGVLMPRRRLLFQIWRIAPGHSDAFSPPAALIAGERCATNPRTGQRETSPLAESVTTPRSSTFVCRSASTSQSTAPGSAYRRTPSGTGALKRDGPPGLLWGVLGGLGTARVQVV